MSLSAMNWAADTHTRSGGAEGTPLTMPERMVLVMLAHHENGRTRRCNPGVDRLVEETGVSKRSVLRHLHTLREAGLITVTQERRKGWAANAYTLAVPQEYRAVDEPKTLRSPTGTRATRKVGKPAAARSPYGRLLTEEKSAADMTPDELAAEERRLRALWAEEDAARASGGLKPLTSSAGSAG